MLDDALDLPLADRKEQGHFGELAFHDGDRPYPFALVLVGRSKSDDCRIRDGVSCCRWDEAACAARALPDVEAVEVGRGTRGVSRAAGYVASGVTIARPR